MGSMFKRLILPGLVFQSICIAGGYGTGRELAEFFLQYGPVGGLLGLLLPATLVISVGSAIVYELARATRSYDYRKFLKGLMGPGWILYEIAYSFTVILVLAVAGAAVGTLVSETFGIPEMVGVVTLLIAIAFLTFKGTKVIEGVMSAWSFVLYAVYISIFVASMHAFGDMLGDGFAKTEDRTGWFLSGLRYGSLCISLVPAILDRPVPVNYILDLLDLRWLQVAFIIMLIGTFIETGTGMIHAINERIAGAMEAIGRSLPASYRALSAIGLLTVALAFSRFGIIDLIAVGYVALAWIYMAILVLPLFTVGVWKLVKRRYQ